MESFSTQYDWLYQLTSSIDVCTSSAFLQSRQMYYQLINMLQAQALVVADHLKTTLSHSFDLDMMGDNGDSEGAQISIYSVALTL